MPDVALVGVVLCVYLLAWWTWENRIKPHRERVAECEQHGHEWGEPIRLNWAVSPDYTGRIRTCTHCGRQEHERITEPWR